MSQISQDVIWHKKSSLLATLTCLGRPLPFIWHVSHNTPCSPSLLKKDGVYKEYYARYADFEWA